MTLDEVINIAANGSDEECIVALKLCRTESKSIRRQTNMQIARAIALARRMIRSENLRNDFYGLPFWKERHSKPNPEKILLHVLMWFYEDHSDEGADRAGYHSRAAKDYFLGNRDPNEFADYVEKSGGLGALLKKPDKVSESDSDGEKKKNFNTSHGQDDSCGTSRQNMPFLSMFEQEATENATLLIGATPYLIGKLEEFESNKHYWLKVSVDKRDDGSFVDLKALKWETEGPTKKLERNTRVARPTYNNEWLRSTGRRFIGNAIKPSLARVTK